MSANATIVGLGNILMRDEGVGVHAVNHIQQNFVVPAGLEIVDGGTSGLDLLPFIEARDHVLFVDAVNFNSDPGSIHVLMNDRIPALFGVKDSLHHMGLMDLLAAAQLLDRLPRQMALVGIQPHTIDTGLQLTTTLQSQFSRLIDQILSLLDDWGVCLQPVS